MRLFFSLIQLALRSLYAYGLRTFLTVLGIVVGVTTVVTVLSVGEGVKELTLKQLDTFGGKTIFAEIRVPLKSGGESGVAQGVQITTLTTRDVEMVKDLPEVSNVYGVVMGQDKITFRDKSLSTSYMGTNASYVEVDEVQVERGRFFTEKEEASVSRVVVLGSEVSERLFPLEDPVGKNVRLGQETFTVVGVMEKRGVVFFQNMDKQVYVPLKTAQKLMLGIHYLLYFVAKVEDEQRIPRIAEEIRFMLRKSHGIPPEAPPEKEDFRVTTMEEAMSTLLVLTNGVELILLFVAFISLLVGGIGIMNTMYVSVVERTREIGMKKALGASRLAILFQFLFEALFITGFGGVLGTLFGVLLSVGVHAIAGSFGFDWDTIVDPQAILLALSSALSFGLLFGYAPARKAASYHPVQALRFEL